MIRRATEHVVMPWANGLGTTAVVARAPDDDDWIWRLSLADVVSDGPFSILPGVDRFIAVASGAGMALAVADGPPVRVTPGDGVFAFDGGACTDCRLLDGPVRDLNLMVRRGVSGSMSIIDLAPGEVLRCRHGDVAVVVLDGSAIHGDAVLGPADAILLEPGDPVELTATTVARLAIATVHVC